MKEIHTRAVVEKVTEITGMIDEFLEEADCPYKVQIAIDIAIDEIFSNICNYAYGGNDRGDASILYDIEKEPRGVRMTFVDEGIPYNPLEKPDPDTSLPAEERPIGGLGIYMVKESMDEVSYEYKDGKNMFSIFKAF